MRPQISGPGPLPARAEAVRRWVETRPHSVRISNKRPTTHPGKGHRNDWKKEDHQ